MLRLSHLLIAGFCSLTLSVAHAGPDDFFPPGKPTPGKPTPAPGTCKNMALPSGKILNYCTYSFQKESIPRNVIYFFHGLNGGPSDLGLLLSSDSPFYPLLNAVKESAPLFISVSFGPRETIPVEPTGEDPNSLRELIDVAMPAIENDYLFYGIRPARHLIGLSLGGYNALSAVAFRPKVFTSVMAICPALIDFNPFEKSEVDAYISRGGPWIQPSMVADMVSALKTKYKTVDIWNARNPMEKMRAGKYRYVNMYLSTGDRDEYGFFEGAEAFATAARNTGSNLVYEPTNGGHCTADLESFSRFLSSSLK